MILIRVCLFAILFAGLSWLAFVLVPHAPVPSLSGWATTVFGFWIADVIWKYGRALKTRYGVVNGIARAFMQAPERVRWRGRYARLWLSLFVLGRATDGQRTITLEGPTP